MSKTIFNTLISADDLATLIPDTNLVMLDCSFTLADPEKGRKEYLMAHIPGAFYMDMEKDLCSPVQKGITGRHPLPHPQVLAYSLKASGLNTDSQVVVYDQSNGMAASRCWWLLNWLGHNRVAVLNGGFNAWKTKGMPVDNQWPAPKKGSFEFVLRPAITIGRQEVAAGKDRIVDSRDYKRFTGENEPIDPIAGHIPGAICIPYIDNTDEKGAWKSKDFLQDKFAGTGKDDDPSPVFYCGSGISACHNILAYKIATGRDARLYPGSWSEWINYYPAATGD